MRSGVRIKGIRSAVERIQLVSERSENLMPLWPRIEAYLREHFLKQFDTEGAAAGAAWQPLERHYEAEKAAAGLRDILVSTGGLRASYLGEGRWTVRKADHDSLSVGSRHPLAHLHQYGSDGGRVPARPVLKVTQEMRRDIKKMIADYVAHGTV